MKNKDTISMTEARKRFFEIAVELQNEVEYYTLTERGRPKMILMSAQTFYSWQTTVGLIEKYANLQEKIRLSEEDKKIKGYIDIEKLLYDEGYLILDKTRQIYEESETNKDSPRNA